MLAAWESWARVERGLSEATIRAYRADLDRLGERAGRDLAALREGELRLSLHEGTPSPATTARRLAAYRSFYRFLTRTAARPDDPTAGLDRPKVRAGLPRPVDHLSEALDRLDPEARAIAVLLSETGLRISEALRLEVPLPPPDALRVLGKGSRERIVPLTEAARVALVLLGGRIELSARSIQRRFRAAGFTPHQLRHTLGCELAASGADLGEIQDILGHASPATTRVYAAYSTDRLRRALERRATR